MKVAVLQSNYLPWKGYFDVINSVDAFVFYDEVKYTKNDWRNRNQIYGANGLFWLTIPIPKGSVKLKISEVAIEDERWQETHFKALCNTYQKAAYFDEIEPMLHEVYRQQRWTRLVDLNRHIIERICRTIGITTTFLDSKNFVLSESRVERLVNLLNQVGSTKYLSGPSAKAYLRGSEQVFLENGIDLVYKSYDGYPEYQQNTEPFCHHVSIIDLLAHVGFRRAKAYISTHSD